MFSALEFDDVPLAGLGPRDPPVPQGLAGLLQENNPDDAASYPPPREPGPIRLRIPRIVRSDRGERLVRQTPLVQEHHPVRSCSASPHDVCGRKGRATGARCRRIDSMTKWPLTTPQAPLIRSTLRIGFDRLESEIEARCEVKMPGCPNSAYSKHSQQGKDSGEFRRIR